MTRGREVHYRICPGAGLCDSLCCRNSNRHRNGLIHDIWAYGQYGGGLIYFSRRNKFAVVNLRARGNRVEEINSLLLEVEERVLQVEGIAHTNAYTRLRQAWQGWRCGPSWVDLLELYD